MKNTSSKKIKVISCLVVVSIVAYAVIGYRSFLADGRAKEGEVLGQAAAGLLIATHGTHGKYAKTLKEIGFNPLGTPLCGVYSSAEEVPPPVLQHLSAALHPFISDQDFQLLITCPVRKDEMRIMTIGKSGVLQKHSSLTDVN